MPGDVAHLRVGRHGKASNAKKRELGEYIIDQRNRGRTMYEISRELGMAERTAYRYLDYTLDTRVAPTVDRYRVIENEKLDRTERENEEQVDTATAVIREGAIRRDAEMVIKGAVLRDRALNTRLRIAERRAKLNGLDAPVIVEATVHHSGPDNDAELQEMIREAQAKMAARDDA